MTKKNDRPTAQKRKKITPNLADRLKQTVDGLNSLIAHASAQEQRALRTRRRESFRQWETAVRLQFSEHTAEVKAATKSLQTAHREIAAAQKDLARIARAIAAAAEAAKLADRALELAIKTL